MRVRCFPCTWEGGKPGSSESRISRSDGRRVPKCYMAAHLFISFLKVFVASGFLQSVVFALFSPTNSYERSVEVPKFNQSRARGTRDTRDLGAKSPNYSRENWRSLRDSNPR